MLIALKIVSFAPSGQVRGRMFVKGTLGSSLLLLGGVIMPDGVVMAQGTAEQHSEIVTPQSERMAISPSGVDRLAMSARTA